jgi:hypothetical protein
MKSDGFRYRIPWKGDPLPQRSSSKAVFDGAKLLDRYTGLEREQSRALELYESTLAIPTQSQVLSLLWAAAEY